MYSNIILDECIEKILDWIDKKKEIYYQKDENYFFKYISLRGTQLAFVTGNKHYSIDKVHLQVKFEYLFWAIEKILFNLKRFEYIIKQFKIEFDFISHKFLRQIYNKSINADTFKIEGKIYKNEINPIVQFVFYPHDYRTEDSQNKPMSNVINILKELFDYKYNVGCDTNAFPRFNFRKNNSVYFALDDSNSKQTNLEYLIENKITPENSSFESPTDYRNLDCTLLDIKNCKKHNLISKKIHNHEICKLNEDANQCINNNGYQHNLLVPRWYNLSLLDIYTMVGQEAEYHRLISE